MKKIIPFLLTASIMAALAASLTACGGEPSSPLSNVNSQGAGMQTPNPWVECKDMAEAVEKAGFDFKIPSDNPTTISVIPGEMIEVSYTHDGSDGKPETVVLRRSPGEGDISGDHTQYAETGSLDINGVAIQTRKEDGRIYVAYFTAFDGSYSAACTTGMTEDQVLDIMTQLLELNAK